MRQRDFLDTVYEIGLLDAPGDKEPFAELDELLRRGRTSGLNERDGRRLQVLARSLNWTQDDLRSRLEGLNDQR